MGLGQIYLNLKGREGHGIVAPGAECERGAATRSSARLLTMTDPKTKARMVDAVYKRDDIYKGPFLKNAVGAAGRLRRRLPRLVADDARRIAAGDRLSEHEEVVGRPRRRIDYKQTAGTLISSRPVGAGRADIMDIAPTVLKYFGVPIPSDIDGKPIF